MSIPNQSPPVIRPVQAGPYPAFNRHVRRVPAVFLESYPPGPGTIKGVAGFPDVPGADRNVLVIEDGGRGYSVNDELTIVGGTFTQPTILKVDAVVPAETAIGMTATGGTFAITVILNGNQGTTPPLFFNITPEDMEAALQRLPIAGADTIEVSGTPGSQYVIIATGVLALTLDSSHLTGGTALVALPPSTPQSSIPAAFSSLASPDPSPAPMSGSIAAVELVQAGIYTELPSNPMTVTGGTGTGAQFFVMNNIVHPNLITAWQLGFELQDPYYPAEPPNPVWNLVTGAQPNPNDPQRLIPVSCYHACGLYSGFSMRRCISRCRR
jgi:hypothetical protein